MKTIRNIVFFYFLAISFVTKGQITLEATYDTASVNLYMVTLEIDGEKYVKIQRGDSAQREIVLYNLNHSVWKTIDCRSFPIFTYCMPGPFGPSLNNGRFNFEVLYITQSLFDSDSDLEFMYNSNGCFPNDHYTGIYNEDGTLIFAQDSAAPYIHMNVPIVFKPIYNTVNGTKMILSFPGTNQSKVYSIPGTLITSNALMSNSSNQNKSFSAYPNPSSNQTTIKYKLPIGTQKGEILILDINGKEIKKYSIDNSFDNIIIPTNELSNGIYFYNLNANGKTLETKKIIVAN